MPSYTFRCKCGTQFEDLVPCTVKTKPCPDCGSHATRQFPCPAIRTSATFLRGRKMLGDQFGHDEIGRRHLGNRIAAARANGLNPNANMTYEPSLAMSPGDPDGFVPHDDPIGHVKRVMAKRGQADLSGEMGDYTPLYNERQRTHRLHPEIVDEEVNNAIAENPSLAKTDINDLREEIIERHATS